jgi:RNA-splicing ligase RtcB
MADLKIFTNNIEQTAQEQIDMLIAQPAFADAKVRIMPDVHAGAGCVIGFTANLGDKVVPNLVGVDIGCGMLTVELGQDEIDCHELDEVIKANIPSGFSVHASDTFDLSDLGLRCYNQIKNVERQNKSLGTLGGGNHFIEVDADDDGRKYLVIHSGSRNLGLQVANIYQKLAEELCSDDVSKSLKYLTGKSAEDYLHDMRICQDFAIGNRALIARNVLSVMRRSELDSFTTIHNYIGADNIIRKGAISAYEGERVLIPLNMRDGSIIAIGKGNADWNYSAPHGAGRAMGRKQAKKTLEMSDFTDQMQGVYSTTVCADTLDEAPEAYKPMQNILDVLNATADVERIIRPLYNFKATG